MSWFRRKQKNEFKEAGTAYEEARVETEKHKCPDPLIRTDVQEATEFDGRPKYRGRILVGDRRVWVGPERKGLTYEERVRSRYIGYGVGIPEDVHWDAELTAKRDADNQLAKAFRWLIDDNYEWTDE